MVDVGQIPPCSALAMLATPSVHSSTRTITTRRFKLDSSSGELSASESGVQEKAAVAAYSDSVAWTFLNTSLALFIMAGSCDS